MAFQGEDSIRVDCHAGYRGEELARRLHLGGRSVDVAAVRDQWLALDNRYFKLERAVYILRHDVDSGDWALVAYQPCPVMACAPYPAGGSAQTCS